jgi:hypothetical protein
VVERRSFAVERAGSPRHSFHVAQLWSLGGFTLHENVRELRCSESR